MGVTEYLNQEVYPRLDAVTAGLLDALNPKRSGSGSTVSYKVTCPACGKYRAYYYPGNTFVVCNRKNECGTATSLWDVTERYHRVGSRREVLAMLCEAAGVPVPDRDGHRDKDLRQRLTLRSAFLAVTRDALKATPEALAYLHKERGLTPAQVDQLGYGFYPNWRFVADKLRDAGVSEEDAIEASIVPPADRRREPWPLDGRIVSIWTMPEGRFVPWGRRMGDGPGPKYYFGRGLIKDRPYGWRGAGQLVWAVEGTMDRDSMDLMGVQNVVAIGGSAVSQGQVRFLAEQRVTDFGHVLDSDAAGLRGAMTTIRRCEPAGITTYIAIIPPGYDDPDRMRQNGQEDVFHRILQGAVTGGEFLARRMLEEFLANPLTRGRLAREAAEARGWLTMASRIDFLRIFREVGVDLNQYDRDAVALYVRLKDLGLEERLIQERVATVTGTRIEVTTTPAQAVSDG